MTRPTAGDGPRDRVIRVVLADDQELVRKGFRVLLEAEPDIEVVGEAADGREAVAQVTRHRPAIVLMDIQMPGMDGLEATRQILEGPRNATRVLILTTFERDDYVFNALRLGASGFLLKTSPPEELIAAINVVAAGEALLSPSVTRRVIARFASHAPPLHPPETLATLTEREQDVLRLLARGMSNAEIGEALFVSEATVKTHMSNLLAKLGLRDRVQAVIFAYEHGLAGRND
ncbi:MAG TPA: response regulator transcription factor [Euzebyales bacterium]|nr:response regulator transcription factor [Euzebyales bacterium]